MRLEFPAAQATGPARKTVGDWWQARVRARQRTSGPPGCTIAIASILGRMWCVEALSDDALKENAERGTWNAERGTRNSHLPSRISHLASRNAQRATRNAQRASRQQAATGRRQQRTTGAATTTGDAAAKYRSWRARSREGGRSNKRLLRVQCGTQGTAFCCSMQLIIAQQPHLPCAVIVLVTFWAQKHQSRTCV